MVFDPHSDPLYQQAIRAMQEGRWQAAIQTLEELLARHPENETIQQALDEALLKQELEINSRRTIHPRRWPAWFKRYLMGVAIVLFLALAIALGILFINQRILPAIAEAQKEYQVKAMLEDGWVYLARGELDEADRLFHQAGILNPGAPEVLDALSAVQRQRQAEHLYQEGVRLQEEGKYKEALEYFMEYIARTPYHRDAPQRILEVHRQLDLADMFQEAKKVFEKGDYARAVELFQNLRARNRWYRPQEVTRYLYEAHMNLGYAALNQALDSIPNAETALDHFRKALQESPRDPEATRQATLAQYYVSAIQAKTQGQWPAVAHFLELIYHQQPDYLDGRILPQLYEAYLQTGDVWREQGDLPMAYHNYLKACQLPITNRTLCQARLNEIIPLITPTPTPTATPTPTPTPTITPTPTPIPPTPTPLPLPLLKGKIVFYSQHPEQPGLWVMNPDGSNRHFYSNSPLVKQQFEKMFEQYRLSPDGRYRAYVTQGPNDDSPQIYIQGQVNQYGIAPTWKVTKGFSKVCYDPMWSPDGAKLVFVSEEDGSDDVWVINIDGSNPINLTPNLWEWDKHPSWSPDGRQIVFWSNRTGIKNIYVMDSDGRHVRNLSNTAWDEWRPLWIR